MNEANTIFGMSQSMLVRATKAVLTTILIFSIAGCATPENPRTANYRNYIEKNRPLVEQGKLKWSDYYMGLYSAAIDSRAPSYVLSQINSLIAHAQNYEAGKTSSEQFAYQRREAQAMTAAQEEAQLRAQSAAQNVNAAATTAIGLQLLQMGSPQPVTTQSPTMTNCRSVSQGFGVVQTTCY